MTRKPLITALILLSAITQSALCYGAATKENLHLKAKDTTNILFIDGGKAQAPNVVVEFDITPQNSSAKVGLILRHASPEEWVYVGCNNAVDYLGFASWIVATPRDTVRLASDIAKLYAHHTRRVRVECRDQLVTLYVDGEQVGHGHFPGMGTQGGAIGFRADGDGEAIISNVTHHELAPEQTVAKSEGKPLTIRSPFMEVALSRLFPAVRKYTLLSDGTTIDAQTEPNYSIRINGEEYQPKVSARVTDNRALYSMSIEPIGVTLKVCCEVANNVLELKITDIEERGDTRVQTIALTDHQLVSVPNSAPGATLSVANNVHSDQFTTLADRASDPTHRYGSIVVLNAEGWAASLENNSIYNTRQFLYRTTERHGVPTTSIWGNEWIYRGLDGSVTELPYIKVAIAQDRNDDQKVDWQDGIIALREIYPAPFGADWIRNSYATITMNFASFAQYPFLRQLDNIKKFYLATDGFGQMLELKGYQSEGHDSGHPDYSENYNTRAGGRQELAFLATEAKRYNALIGVHINQSESYPEARAFNEKIVTDMPGWSWLDQAYFINKEADVLGGGFKARLNGLHRDIPDLSFVYIDTYREYRWLAYNTAREFVGNGWAVWTEDADVFDKEACWIHYQPESKSMISRMLHHQNKDGYAAHPALLGGYDHSTQIGFMGWQKGRDFNGVIRNFFTVQLPFRYLMHFPVMGVDSTSARFTDNVTSRVENGKTAIKRDSRYVMRDGAVFIPWNPTTEDKIYYYNPEAGSTVWDLPLSWADLTEVYLYELSATGRTLARTLPVKGGAVTIDTPASKGYVIYKTRQEPMQPVEWSQGALLADQGFDSQGFDHWKINSAGDAATIDETPYGQSFLNIAGKGSVSQRATGLKAGASYAASVWVDVTGRANASLGVKIEGQNELQSSVSSSDVTNYTDNTDKFKTTYQRLKVCFTMPANATEATITLAAAPCNDTSSVAFDDVRLLENSYSTKEGYIYFEDFESVDEGWGPFIASQSSAFTSHLAQRHDPYTDDVINGEWSFKTWRENNGEMLRTSPTLVGFAPSMRYTVDFTYKVDKSRVYKAVVRSRSKGLDLASHELNRDGVCTLTFETADADDCYIAIDKNGNGELIIDDFGIRKLWR